MNLKRLIACSVVIAVVLVGVLVGGASTRTTASAATTTPTTVSFTFDDTFADQIAASRVLDEYGMKGTFYVTSTRINTSSLYMSRAQTDALFSSGHEIAGHTLGHADLTTATDTEARRQICDDRLALNNMGYPATSFAYPFGSTSTSVKQAVSSCGYSSARGVGNLRSPGYGCNSCATAETIPPVDKWDIKTNKPVQSDTTVEMLQTYVEQAENDVGGWVPLVFHRICTGCSTNSMDIASFRRFVDWLSKRPSSTQVRTVNQVMGGAVPPTPVSVPGAPTGITAVRGVRQATVKWTAPAKTGGAAITKYTITSTPGGIVKTVTGTVQSLAFTGLANGTKYTFKVTATNRVGAGIASAASRVVIPAGRPSAPRRPAAAAGRKWARVTWAAPATNGAAATRYQITSSTGVTKTAGPTVRTVKFMGLRKGKRISFRVRAANSVGVGAYSPSSATVKIK